MFQSLKFFSSKIALIDSNNKKITYRKLVEDSEFIKKNLNKKSINLIIASNTYESICGYIGFLNQSKNITILLDESFNNKFINKIISIYKPNFIYSPINFKFILNFLKVIKFKNYVLYKTKFKNNKKINFKNYLLLSTSGTTQSPKFVRHSKNSILDNTKKIIENLKIKKNHMTITTLPMGYSYGLSVINTHLLSGGTIVINKNTIFEKEFWKKFQLNNITSLNGVPEFYEFLRRINIKNYKISNLKFITQAGGKLAEPHLLYYQKLCASNKINFIVMYGQTEAGPRMSSLIPKYFHKKINSIGKPLKTYKFSLVNKQNKKLDKIGDIGEIIFKGKSVCLGYSKTQRDLTKGDVNNNILATGDLAKKDKDGFYYIVGRKNKIIKLFGKRINLLDVEKFLKKKNILAKCYYNDKKLDLKLLDKQSPDKVKHILSIYLNINKNFINIGKKENKNNFKSISR
tara:strand:+ start:850 stop:2226 length:1377 start_codon:yes stop_codon:yes gene_type:complete